MSHTATGGGLTNEPKKNTHQMCPRDAYTFTIFQTSDIFPIDFVVTKARPAVLSRLATELIVRASNGSGKEQFASDRIVKLNFSAVTLSLFEFVDIGLVAKSRAWVG